MPSVRAEEEGLSSESSALGDEIRHRADQLYLERGQEPGHELDDWLQAERASTVSRFRGRLSRLSSVGAFQERRSRRTAPARNSRHGRDRDLDISNASGPAVCVPLVRGRG